MKKQHIKLSLVCLFFLIAAGIPLMGQWYDLTDTTFINRFEGDTANNDVFAWTGTDWANLEVSQDNELLISNAGVKWAEAKMELTNDSVDISENPVIYFEAKTTDTVTMIVQLVAADESRTYGQFSVKLREPGVYKNYGLSLEGSWADLTRITTVIFGRGGRETVDCDLRLRYLSLGTANGSPTVDFTVSTTSSAGGSINLVPDGGTYNAGETVTATAVPGSGYLFDSWSGAASGTTNPLYLTVNTDLTLTANFVEGTVSSSAYYVSRAGGASDSNPGTLEQPFLTIQKAATVATAGDTVYVREGTYRETITPVNSGEIGNPIVYMPYNNEEVTISGTEIISGWELHGGNIYKAPMAGNFFTSSVNMTDQVFVDGRMMNLARWPNTSLEISYPVKAVANKFVSKTKEGNITTGVMEDDDIPAGDYSGAEIYMQPNNGAWSWTLTGEVQKVEGSKFTFTSFSGSGQDFSQNVYHPNSRYYFFNKLSLLDTVGEWYHDKEAGLLYLWLPENANPEDHLVEAKKRDYGFNLSNKGYIEIIGFEIFGCNITTDEASGGDGKGYTEEGEVRYPWRGKGSIAESHHITINGITCLYPSHSTDLSGHFFFQYGSHSGIVLSGTEHVIKNSIIRYSFANGISLLGYRHEIHNNLIEDVNYAAGGYGAMGSSAAKAFDCIVSYNTIRRTGRSGIRLGIRNSDPANVVARLHHNEISDYMLQDRDGGGIYMGGDGKFLRIDHNIIHDGKGYIVSGIYPDWGKNYIFDHNVLYNHWANFQFTHSFDKEGINNFVVYNNTAICTNNDGFVHGPFNFVCSGGKEGVILKNNIGWVYTPPVASSYRAWSDAGTFDEITRSHNLFETDPMLRNYPYDFQLQAGSPAIDAGEPMDTVELAGVKIPPFNDPVVGTMDIGAYEFGLAPFQAGSSLDTATGSKIEIYAAGKSGTEKMIMMFMDNPVAVFDSVAGDATTGEFIKFTYNAKGEIAPEMVKIWFGNPGGENELRIDKITIDGTVYQSEDVFCSCTPENTEYLTCQGYFQYQSKNQFSISIVAENGSVEMDPPGGTYNEGTQVILTATPDEGYVFTGWSGDAGGTGNPKTIQVNRNRAITANFEQGSAIHSLENIHGDVKVFPNPIQDNTINVETDGSWEDYIIFSLYDAHGRLLKRDNRIKSNGITTIGLHENTVPPGIYTLRIEDSAKMRYIKIIKK
jgi:uncharacterized repeat protein (TIGR02543 family)